MEVCTREAQAFVEVPSRNGYQAWKQLTDHYDPRGGIDRGRAFTKVTQPQLTTRRAKDASKAMQILKTWENEMYTYTAKCNDKMSDTSKITPVKSIMPEEMFGAKGAFRGRVYESYEQMRRDIMHFLEDRPPKEAVGMDIGIIGEEQQREEEQEEGDASRKNEGSIPESDMIGNIYAAMFGGKGKGSGGWNGWGNWQGKGGKYGYQPNYGPWGRQNSQNQNWQSEKAGKARRDKKARPTEKEKDKERNAGDAVM